MARDGTETRAGRRGSRAGDQAAGRTRAAATVAEAGPVRHDVAWLGDVDLHLFNEGSHFRLYEKLGAHPTEVDGVAGTHFAVWAPNAARVSVVGGFNGWAEDAHALRGVADSGIWTGFVPGVGAGAVYKYHIRSHQRGFRVNKADPFGFRHELPPATASVVASLDYDWGDAAWLETRAPRMALEAPQSIYEVHLGSWMRSPERGGRFHTYREFAPLLGDYLERNGFTHVEFLPLMEHPFYGSWGYQTTGFFAPTSRFGGPTDFMYLVDHLHRRGIGVILDWVPSHFPTDEHGLGYFDGTHLFEHGDPRQGYHPDWNSYIFNYGRNEVRSFLGSSAFFWLDRFHADGLRVDAVASMLYLDYSRKEGEWIPNEHGGRENIDAIHFLRGLNQAVYRDFGDVQTYAEESTAWPMVSRPTYLGGLGFGMKWDMGWMHDTLEYFRQDPIHRRWHHGGLTFRMIYAFNENFVLPLSHDEVVHGKGSLLDRMPGDAWQKFANLRLLYGYMWAQPGKKLLFMGGEIAHGREWAHDHALDWHLLEHPQHAGVQRWVTDLNRMYRSTPALFRRDFDHHGFEWIEGNDAENSVLSFIRRDGEGGMVLCIFNFTPVPRQNYRLGVPCGGRWNELLNSDATLYGGSGQGNMGGVEATPIGAHGRDRSIVLTLPPLGALIMRPAGASRPRDEAGAEPEVADARGLHAAAPAPEWVRELDGDAPGFEPAGGS
ncbi:MAG: 1,4-alpha-glucan branching protein GlgB [Longimicrobiales bacterium]